ncbi:fam-l protein [Plasmodium malariae]|uniref:Fam-l protein n=1 Tax=Plasmodium malariae TaxID=5858 RepID=A0A1D3JMY9_PLAMA|nr:fam-l protein [Plasmodium malariae]SBT88036.1 fam-l protein [Plasmodium malariae]
MEQKMKHLFFFKIYTFMLLTWLYHFYDNMYTSNKYIYGNYMLGKQIGTRTYRFLAKCKDYHYSTIIELKEGMSSHTVSEKKDISNNRKGIPGKKKLSNGNSSKNARESEQPMKNKYGSFEIKNLSHMEKKILKELDYLNFLKNNRTTRDKIYKSFVRKKYGLRLCLPLLMLLLLIIGLIVELSLGFTGKSGLLIHLGLKKSDLESLVTSKESGSSSVWMTVLKWLLGSSSSDNSSTCYFCNETLKTLSDMCALRQFFSILIYLIPFFLLAITLISALVYYFKNVKKYKKFKFRKRKNKE